MSKKSPKKSKETSPDKDACDNIDAKNLNRLWQRVPAHLKNVILLTHHGLQNPRAEAIERIERTLASVDARLTSEGQDGYTEHWAAGMKAHYEIQLFMIHEFTKEKYHGKIGV